MKDSVQQREKEALEQLIRGDQDAFTCLYQGYVGRVYHFALTLVKSEEAAENITQEVFIKLWETRERIDSENSFSGYLYTIARNITFNQHRKQVNERVYLDYLSHVFPVSEKKTEQDMELLELQQNIDRCIDGLRPQRKKVFELSRFQGLSHKEISAQLGIAEKTIATHIRLALQDLRKLL